MTVRLDEQTRQRLQDIVAGRYRSANAAIVDAINKRWQELQDEQLDAAYAAAVDNNPAYPYESEAERSAARLRRNARQRDSG
ncbi:antitoxin [Mycobacterium sp. SM1]|uniref:antitoxin n=1 Tax=Mycobacterium sp. SM1 TaxID=2816243 RepID=UPI001BCC60F9|nr:antitoxin [Mycobacterium sp. SM1]MBS4730713.1 antitoxin [Mycobacterium sp. SM1]